MVSNEEVKEEFDMFSTVWNFYKEALPVYDGSDDAYWERIVQKSSNIRETYSTELCKEILLAILAELERKGKSC